MFSSFAIFCILVSTQYLDEILNVPFLKIGSGDVNNHFVLEKVARLKHRNAVVSTGMSDLNQVQTIYKLFKKSKVRPQNDLSEFAPNRFISTNYDVHRCAELGNGPGIRETARNLVFSFFLNKSKTRLQKRNALGA